MKKSLLLGLSVAALSAVSFVAHSEPSNWYATNAVKDRSVSADVMSSSDVVDAHRQGWKGQGTALITVTMNDPTYADQFHSFAAAVAPAAHTMNFGNISSQNDAVSYAAFAASKRDVDALHAGRVHSLSGVGVAGYTNSNIVGVTAGTLDYEGEIIGQGKEVEFQGVHNGGVAVNEYQSAKTAYIAASAALISSKFPNLVADEVVRNMDQSRIDDKFSLTKSLSPKGTLR